jgi:hypothetical protein
MRSDSRLARTLRGLVLACLLGSAVLAAATCAAAVAQPAAHVTGPAPKARHRAAGPNAVSLSRSATVPFYACPRGACEAVLDPRPARRSGRFALPGGHLLEGGGELGGYDPQDLQSAYQIPSAGGEGQTVALVDAFGYPSAEADLAKYRSRYGLPACTKASGCFRKVNEAGEEAHYPAANPGWEAEAALDLDMVSAACPSCHLILVEGSTELPADLGASVNTAAKLGATEISNSYGYPEDYAEWCGGSDCLEYAADYNHPGIEIVASAGDTGYDNHFDLLEAPDFPATSPNVIAVGGTSLHKAGNGRGWTEAVWNEPAREIGTGGGCSLVEAKPKWQTDTGCTRRTDNDISADAACETPVSMYATPLGGWEDLCGTSASSPLVAGILAHASEALRAQGADAFYLDPAALFDVTSGVNGSCPPAADEYLCTAGVGYDGPTGLGTPDGLPAVSRPSVSAISPAIGRAGGGTNVKISGSGFTAASAVTFGATSASAFTVNSASSITATAPPGSGTVDVTVTTSAGTSETLPADRFTDLAGPEFGRCLKVAAGTGQYAGGTCTTNGTKNSYEWFPAFGGANPIAKRRFTIADKAPTVPKLETTTKQLILCTGESATGEYTGARTVAGVVVTFSGCHLGSSGSCQSASQSEGHVATFALGGELGVTLTSGEGPSRNKIGLDLAPSGGELLASLTCGTTPVAIRGSVIGEVTRNVMTSAGAMHFIQAKGVQRVTHFEGAAEDVLQAQLGEGTSFAGAGLALTALLDSEEKIEISSVE